MSESVRSRFVEAMRHLLTEAGRKYVAAAVEAFADAECNENCWNALSGGDHTACRAALLRECGL